MTTYETRVQTPWSVDKAFAYMSDLSNYSEWDLGTKRATHLDGDHASVGARYELAVGRTTLRYEIIEVDAPRKQVAKAKDRFLTSVDTVTVEPGEGTGSVVTYHAHLTLNGPLAIADPLLGIQFHRMGEKAADGLADKLDGRRLT